MRKPYFIPLWELYDDTSESCFLIVVLLIFNIKNILLNAPRFAFLMQLNFCLPFIRLSQLFCAQMHLQRKKCINIFIMVHFTVVSDHILH